MNTRDILDKLKGVGKSGDGWSAKCPSHNDKSPSLSIHESNGKILLYCHAGCSLDMILEALGITVADLFSINGNEDKGRIVAEYDYTDESGTPLYQVIRYEPKNFRMRRKVDSVWVYNLDGVRRVPYNLPQLLAAQFVLMLEGEKDSECARKLGIAATSSTHWRPDFAE